MDRNRIFMQTDLGYFTAQQWNNIFSILMLLKRGNASWEHRGESTISSNYNATGSMLGYLYQCREALLLAIIESKSQPGLSISIERFDDVAFEENGTASEQLQLKHHVNAASLTDMSIDLWKTFRIWSEQTSENLNLPFERHFSIVTTAQAAVGSAAELLRYPRASADAEEKALELLCNAATNSISQETAAGRKAFLALSKHDQRNLISAIRVHDNSPSIVDSRSEIEDLLNFAAPSGKVTYLVDHLEGWWFAQIVTCLSNSNAPAISLLAMRAKIEEIASSFRTGELYIDPDALAVSKGDLSASDNRIFVKQMRCVELGDESIELAKLDYYRATAQRSTWARENALLDGEATRYDADLVERWTRERLARESSGKPISDDDKKVFGRDLFHWANRAQLPFRNRHEQWLCSGSYQILADSVKVGWHPDHSTMFGLSAKGRAA